MKQKIAGNAASLKYREQLNDLIKNQYNFRNADPAEIAEMISYASYERFDEGKYLYFEGEPVTHLFFILDGAVNIHCYRKDESVKRWGDVAGGSMISVYELYQYKRIHRESALCLKDTRVAMVSVDDFFNHVLKLNSIAAAMLDYMAFIVEDLIDEIRCVSVRDHILLYFRRQMVYLKRYETRDGVIQLFRDHYYDHIAEVTGCARETVNRELRRLEKEGMITLTKTHIIISDPALLG